MDCGYDKTKENSVLIIDDAIEEKAYTDKKEIICWHYDHLKERRKMVCTRDWKYVHDPMVDRDERYDLQRDPWELQNVVDEQAK